MGNISSIRSPLTGNTNVEFLDSLDTNKLISEWKQDFAIDISNELEGISKIDLYKCNETGLRFFFPASTAGSENLYAQLQKFSWFYMPWKWEHEVLFSRLKAGEKVLEVGCAKGSFIEKLRSSGFDAEGIEFNSLAAAEARERGIPVSSQELSALSYSKKGTFDVVCHFQVLEHVTDPATFINECIALLKPGGRLVMCAPNNESFLKYQYNLLDMPPHHMTQWSVKTFQSLEKLFPVRLFYVKYEPLAPYHIDGYLIAHKTRLLKRSSLYRLILNRYTIPMLRFAFKSGLRHFCKGQSIYVELIKL